MREPREPRSIIEAAEHAAAAGDYPAAEELLREAALLQEASLGPVHPDLANTLNNLGVVCEITDKPDAAEQYFRRACAIATETLEQDHPFVTTSQKNLRDFCQARGMPLELPTPAPVPTPEVAATPEMQVTPTGDPPRESHVLEPSQDHQPLEDRKVFGRLAIVLGPIAMLMVILAAGPPRLGSTDRVESTSASRTTEPAGDLPAVPRAPASVEPVEVPKESSKTTGSGSNESNAGGIAVTSTTARPTVVRAQLCAHLREWQCDPPGQPVRPGPLLFYTQIKSTSVVAVQHRWYQGSRLHHSVELRIQANPTVGYRTYSRNTVSETGNWKVELATDDGVVLHEERFSVQ